MFFYWLCIMIVFCFYDCEYFKEMWRNKTLSQITRLSNNFISHTCMCKHTHIYNNSLKLIFFFFFWFLGQHLQNMEVPKLWGGIRVAVASLHHSSQQHWILNTLRKARDPTCIMHSSWIYNLLSQNRNSLKLNYFSSRTWYTLHEL